MKMKRSQVGLMVLAISTAVTVCAQVVALPGQVTEVENGEVTVEACGYFTPRVDDLLEIGFKNPGQNVLDISVWRVVDVEECRVRVAPVCDDEQITIGQSATLFVNAASAGRAVAPSPAEVVRDEPDERAEILDVLALLESEDSRDRQRAAKVLYRHYRYDPLVQASVESILAEGYGERPRDAYHVDAMAWLCKILGASGNPDFVSILDQVKNHAASYKLRRYAATSLYQLM